MERNVFYWNENISLDDNILFPIIRTYISLISVTILFIF